jgi:hypothetical protein
MKKAKTSFLHGGVVTGRWKLRKKHRAKDVKKVDFGEIDRWIDGQIDS